MTKKDDKVITSKKDLKKKDKIEITFQEGNIEAEVLQEDNKAKEKELSFEENLEQLEEIVKQLESGSVPLDNAIEEFTKAMKLAKKCDESLKNAEEAITKLVNETGEVKDFKVEE